MFGPIRLSTAGQPAERVALLALERFEAAPVVPHLLGGQAIEREEEAVTLIRSDLGGRQTGG
ncbi:MAG: hypothetical protein WDN25_10335 [Acetobacteraceae bacterium]